MARLIVIQGTPCSGKTTWARAQVAGKKDWVIVSPDEIRHALGDYWVPEREKLVDRTERFLLETALKMGYTAISDATNFDEQRVARLRDLAADLDVAFELKRLYVPFREAVRRDGNADRRHHLGEKKIREFYERRFPDKLAEELASPDPSPAPSTQIARLMTDADGMIIWAPTADDVENVRALSLLHYKLSDIALILEVPEDEMRRHITIQDSPVFKAYHRGRLESEHNVRTRVTQAAERGEEWAIKQTEAWDRERLKEELGFQK